MPLRDVSFIVKRVKIAPLCLNKTNSFPAFVSICKHLVNVSFIDCEMSFTVPFDCS